MRCYVVLMLLLLAACATETEPAAEALSSEPAFDSPRALIAAMRDRYDGQWYQTLTFVQQTIEYDQDGVADTATWHEAYAAPGRLRIDVAPLEDGNGFLFASDTQYVFQNGELANKRPRVHVLLLLGFDVYHLPAEETTQKLEDLGFDLSKIHQTMWQDRPMYVVGAEAGEERQAQFWIDQEHLYFTRLLQPVGPDSLLRDIQFNNYERIGEAWIAPEVVFNFDNTVRMLEHYRDIQTGVALDTTLFNPNHWR